MLRSIGSVAALALLMVGCGGGSGGGSGSGSSEPPPTPIKIGGGSVSGLVGSGLVIQVFAPNPDGSKHHFAVSDPLQVKSDGPFTLYTSAFYSANPPNLPLFILITQQPSSPTQSCLIVETANGGAYADVACSQFVYATNAGDNTVSAYTLDASSGTLAAIGAPTAAGASPHATVGVEYSGKRFLYVANEVGNDVSAFVVNNTTGALTAVNGSPFSADTDPEAMALYGSRELYVANTGSDNVSAYAIDQNTGALSGPSTIATGKSPTSVVVDLGTAVVYVANHGGSNDISAFSVDGPLVPGSPFPAGGNPLSLAIGGGGKFLYTANPDATNPSISGFSIDPISGALLPLNGSPFSLPVSHYIATDRTGAYLYVTTGANIAGYAIDATTGALTALPGFPVSAGANAYSVSIDPFNQFLYVADDSAANIAGFTLDSATGALTPMSGSPFPAGSHPEFLATFIPSTF